jgi:hypothetical protein
MAVNEMWKGGQHGLRPVPDADWRRHRSHRHHASDELKQKYLPKMVEGTWTGTMNLTEPNAGSDLAAISSKAKAVGDGSYPGQRHQDFHHLGRARLSPRTSFTSCWPVCRMRRRD